MCALWRSDPFQQVGIQYTTVGKAGLITGLYVVIVPILGLCLRQKSDKRTIGGALLRARTLFSCVKDDFSMGWGESLVLLGATFWASACPSHRGSANKRNLDPLRLALVQYLVCAGLNLG